MIYKIEKPKLQFPQMKELQMEVSEIENDEQNEESDISNLMMSEEESVESNVEEKEVIMKTSFSAADLGLREGTDILNWKQIKLWKVFSENNGTFECGEQILIIDDNHTDLQENSVVVSSPGPSKRKDNKSKEWTDAAVKLLIATRIDLEEDFQKRRDRKREEREKKEDERWQERKELETRKIQVLEKLVGLLQNVPKTNSN
ncbi:uncharacterized protein [Centruroides vittatus]|uniref:uncharacterized protein isoform X2 n=1 Tax=Centruroides vittatus TaxID=120091 RepID=UPI00350FF880